MGYGERLVLLLKFREQAHVLNRNDRLIGEGLEERDLLVREGAHLLTSDQDPADSHAFAEQRYREHGPMVEPALEGSANRKFALALRGEIVDVDGSSVRYRSPRRRTAIAW